MEANPVSATVNEIQATKKLLESNQRQDFRAPMELRPLSISHGKGSAVIKLGSTIVSCVTTSKEIPTRDDRPNEGVHSLCISSPMKLDSNLRSELLNTVRDSLNKAKALDLESLCIRIGERAWELTSNVVILENDGGLIDAIQIAVFCSLLSVRVPGPRGERSITVHHLPLSVTYAIFDENLIFADPSFLELAASSGTASVVMNAQGELCGFHKNGGVAIHPNLLDFLISSSLHIVRVWHSAIIDAFGADAPLILKNAWIPSISPEPPLPIEPKVPVEQHKVEEEKEEKEEVETLDPSLMNFLGL